MNISRKFILLIWLTSTLIGQEDIQNEDLIKILERENFIQKPTESQILRMKNYLEEILQIQENLERIKPLLESIDLVKNNETYVELKNYRLNYFERKEELVFSEIAKIEWGNNQKIKRIIFRDRSVYTPSYTRKLIFFILPRIEKQNIIIEPPLFFLTSISYNAGQGKRNDYYFPEIFMESIKENHISAERVIFYNEIHNIQKPSVIYDSASKVRLVEYISFRMRNLEIKIRSIYHNTQTRKKFDFSESIPDDRY